MHNKKLKEGTEKLSRIFWKYLWRHLFLVKLKAFILQLRNELFHKYFLKIMFTL